MAKFFTTKAPAANFFNKGSSIFDLRGYFNWYYPKMCKDLLLLEKLTYGILNFF